MSRTPFKPAELFSLSNIQNEVSNLVDRLKRLGAAAMPFDQGFQPTVDVQEELDRYVLTVELPGVSADSLEVTAGPTSVTIAGDKPRPVSVTEPGVGEFPRIVQGERRFGRFSRVVTLSGSVRTDGVDATLAGGVLTLVLAKVAGPKPVEVHVTVKSPDRGGSASC